MKSYRGRPSKKQKAIVRLLNRSPLPWTKGMLDDWFGRIAGGPWEGVRGGRRIRSVAPGLYTSARKFRAPVERKGAPVMYGPPISDEYIESRFGMKL